MADLPCDAARRACYKGDMSTTTLAPILFHWLVGMVPPHHFDLPVTEPWAREPRAEVVARFRTITEVIERVVLDPAEQPVYPGPRGRAHTAALLLVIGVGETRFSRDTHLGYAGNARCYAGPGHTKRCDSGRSACPFQLNIGAGKTPEGWTREDLFGNFEKCARAALHAVRRSAGAARRCGLHSPAEWLNTYATGDCRRGADIGAGRVGKADALVHLVRGWQNGLPEIAPSTLAAFGESAEPQANRCDATSTPLAYYFDGTAVRARCG